MKHKAVRKAVRKFAETELGPISHEIDRESRFPWEVIEKMRPLNYFGLQVPQKYGGADLDTISYAITIEELFRSFPMTIPVAETLCAYPCPKKYPRIAPASCDLRTSNRP
jgi:butyryl-CoA dehydrogenase